jgi:hypothetical protein
VIRAFDRIVIEAGDPERAAGEYSALLGAFEAHAGRWLRRLANVSIELRRGGGNAARIAALHLADDRLAAGAEQRLATDTRGLDLVLSGAAAPAPQPEPGPTGIRAVDHIVLRSADADDCIRLFGDGGLGIRLALDQQVLEWGGRMLFFRTGKMTLEIIHNLENPPQRDDFWGISYQCDDIEATIAALDAAGVAHSPIRPGRKPGTRVATVKSHCLGLPTLLVGPDA